MLLHCFGTRLRRWRPMAMVTAGLLLAACAQTTQIKQRYQALSAHPIDTLLIAAQTPDTAYRADWEAACQRVFKGSGPHVLLSDKVLPNWDGQSPKPLASWGKGHHAAILMVDITALLLAPSQHPQSLSSDSFGITKNGPNEDDIGKPDWSIFIGRRAKPQQQPPRLHHSEAQLLSDTGKMLWDGVLTTHEANDLDAIATSQCKAIKKQLGALTLLN